MNKSFYYTTLIINLNFSHDSHDQIWRHHNFAHSTNNNSIFKCLQGHQSSELFLWCTHQIWSCHLPWERHRLTNTWPPKTCIPMPIRQIHDTEFKFTLQGREFSIWNRRISCEYYELSLWFHHGNQDHLSQRRGKELATIDKGPYIHIWRSHR